jgi:hypothetical protein
VLQSGDTGLLLAGVLLACTQLASAAAGDATMFGTNDILEVRNVMPLTRADDATPIEIDGRLDEAVWRDLPVISDFVVIEPDTLAKAAVRHPRKALLHHARSLRRASISSSRRRHALMRLSSRDFGFQVARDEVSFTHRSRPAKGATGSGSTSHSAIRTATARSFRNDSIRAIGTGRGTASRN